jgi:hypothetical protein
VATTEDLLLELLGTAQEQLRWLRASVLPDVRATIETTLRTTQLRRAYEMCDGQTTSREIAAAVGASPASLSNWTRRWRDLGIAYETAGGAIKHLVSLGALGIPLEVDVT